MQLSNEAIRRAALDLVCERWVVVPEQIVAAVLDLVAEHFPGASFSVCSNLETMPGYVWVELRKVGEPNEPEAEPVGQSRPFARQAGRPHGFRPKTSQQRLKVVVELEFLADPRFYPEDKRTPRGIAEVERQDLKKDLILTLLQTYLAQPEVQSSFRIRVEPV